MNQLEDYFREGPDAMDGHPLLLRLVEAEARPDFRDAKVEVVRPPDGPRPRRREAVPPSFRQVGAELGRPEPEEWDDGLNAALIGRRIRAVDEGNEKVRFSLSCSPWQG